MVDKYLLVQTQHIFQLRCADAVFGELDEEEGMCDKPPAMLRFQTLNSFHQTRFRVTSVQCDVSIERTPCFELLENEFQKQRRVVTFPKMATHTFPLF